MKGLVLAGGHGTRLRPLTFTGNKHMLPVANQPILLYALQNLAEAGIRDVAVVLGPIYEGIPETLGDGRQLNLKIEYIHQGDPKGLAHAVLCAREFLGDDPFLMYLGDNLLQTGVRPYLDRFAAGSLDAVVGAATVPHPERYGVVELDGDRVVSLEEKPARPKSNLALIGVYLFSPAIHPIIQGLRPSARGELEITEAIWRLVQSGGKVSTLRVDGWWKDTGHPDDLLEANELVLRTLGKDRLTVKGVVREGAVLEGPVGIGPETVIEAGARLIGPTVIGSGSVVGPGSRIGPNCALGDRVVVRGATVRRSIVMDGTLLDGVSITDSIVGRNVQAIASRRLDHEVTLTMGDSSKVIL